MKNTVFSIIFLMLLNLSLDAQQWEFGYGDGESFIRIGRGVLNPEGNGILVGDCGPSNTERHPFVARVEPDGTHYEREYDSLDGLWLNHVVQLNNGNYLAVGTHSTEAVGVMVLDANLDVIVSKRYEKPETALLVYGGRLLLDDDGTVVVVGRARYPTSYGYATYPYLYRFDENGDTLRCRYVMPVMPEPEYYMRQFECNQVLKNPRDGGLIVIGIGRNGHPSLISYDRDFNYVGNAWIQNDETMPFYDFVSSCWLSDEELLVFSTLWPGEHDKRNIALLKVKLSGEITRLDTICTDSVYIQLERGICAFVNDTTIYGTYGSSVGIYDPEYPSVCLFNKDMEVLGKRVFLDEEYLDYYPTVTLPQNDGGCIVFMCKALTNSTRRYKVMKLSREDFNPIPCGVEEAPQETARALAYPNPAKDALNIDITGLSESGRLRVQVTDATGRVCMERVIRGDGDVMKLDIRTLKPGLYFYTIQDTQKGSLNGKFLKE